MGEPTLTDPARTTAPMVSKDTAATFQAAMGKGSAEVDGAKTQPDAVSNGTAPPRTGDAGAVKLEDVPEGNAAPRLGLPSSAAPTSRDDSGGGAARQPPAADGGLKAVGPTDATPLPAAEKPAEAAEQVNDVKPSGTSHGSSAGVRRTRKTPKPAYDPSQESSSKHKKKTGLDKLNPF